MQVKITVDGEEIGVFDMAETVAENADSPEASEALAELAETGKPVEIHAHAGQIRFELA